MSARTHAHSEKCESSPTLSRGAAITPILSKYDPDQSLGTDINMAVKPPITPSHLSRVSRQQPSATWSENKDLLCDDIRRGQECLTRVRREISVLEAKMEDWPEFEKVCGKNPLPDYMQMLSDKERVERFLVLWLKRREKRLHTAGQLP